MKTVNEREAYETIVSGLGTSRQRAWIASPWITIGRRLLEETPAEDVRILLRNSGKKDRQISDFESLKSLDSSGKARVRCSINLHAKMYVFDTFAVVTSSNLTNHGMGLSAGKNDELGVLLTEPHEVVEIQSRFENLWDTASNISETNTHQGGRRRRGIRSISEVLSLFRPQNPLKRIFG